MGRPLKTFFSRLFLVFAALLSLGGRGLAAGYDSLVEQGGFYLERGPAYGADAVRALEAALAAEPSRASADARVLSALARAYALVSRYTESAWMLDAWKESGGWNAEGEALRTRLLTESGLARLRLVSAAPLEPLTLALKTAADTRLDLAARKAFDRLTELLGRTRSLEPGGLTFLVPEGRFELSCSGPGLFSPRAPVAVELTAGEENVLRLIPFIPARESWKVVFANRSVALSWPGNDGSVYELTRETRGKSDVVYRGRETQAGDEAPAAGETASYTLKTFDAAGEWLAASSLVVEGRSPVSRLSAAAALETDLRVAVTWELGEGSVDRVRVVRRRGLQEETLAEVHDPARLQRGALRDGPLWPEGDSVALSYRVEAWLEDAGSASASGTAKVELPRRVAYVTDVVQSIERGAVVVQWETFPKEGAAQGYRVYVQKGDGLEGELVARVEDPFAREYVYDVEDPMKASGWHHFVVPYVGDRVFLDFRTLTVRGKPPEESFERRLARGAKLPNVALFWDPCEDAVAYEVAVAGRKEVLVTKPYVEFEGLQSPLLGASHTVTVTAVTATGTRVELLKQELAYRHYPRPARKEQK